MVKSVCRVEAVSRESLRSAQLSGRPGKRLACVCSHGNYWKFLTRDSTCIAASMMHFRELSIPRYGLRCALCGIFRLTNSIRMNGASKSNNKH